MDSAYDQTTSTTAPAKPVSGAGSSAAGLLSFAPFIAIMVLFYFIMVYPQSKERKKKEEMLGGIQRGDRVLTRGGIYGTVADIKEQVLILKISENSKVEVDRSFIETVQKQS